MRHIEPLKPMHLLLDISAENSEKPVFRLSIKRRSMPLLYNWSMSLKIELREAITLSLPIAGAQLAQVALSVIDHLMCGRLGPLALAGVGLGSASLTLLLIPLLGWVGVVSAFVSESVGAEQEQDIVPYVQHGLFLAGLLGVIGTLLLSVAPAILNQFDYDPALLQVTYDYLHSVRWSLLPALAAGVLKPFLDSLHLPRIGLWVTLSGIGLNIVANLGLMFGKWGLPALGVAGTGWATSLVNCWILFCFVAVILWHQPLRKYPVFKSLQNPLQTDKVKAYLSIGGPIGLTILFEVALFSGLSFLMGKLGPTALAAHQIALSLCTITFMFALGVSYATTVRVANGIGRKNLAYARRAGLIGMALGMGVMGCAGLSFVLIPEPLISLYLEPTDIQNQAVIQLTVKLLYLAAFFQIFDALQVTSQGALRGLKDTFWPMLISLVCYWCIGYGSALGLGFYGDLGAPGLWFGLILGLFSAGIVLSSRFFILLNQRSKSAQQVELELSGAVRD